MRLVVLMTLLFAATSYASQIETLNLFGNKVDLTKAPKNELTAIMNEADSITIQLQANREQIVNALRGDDGQGSSGGGGLTNDQAQRLLNGERVVIDLRDNDLLRGHISNGTFRSHLGDGGGIGSGG